MTPSYRPSVQQELLLQAALLPEEAARTAWRRIRTSIAFEALDGASQSLLPLVYRSLMRFRAGVDGIDALKERYLFAWSEN